MTSNGYGVHPDHGRALQGQGATERVAAWQPSPSTFAEDFMRSKAAARTQLEPPTTVIESGLPS